MDMRFVLFFALAIIFSGTLKAQNSFPQNNFGSRQFNAVADSVKLNNFVPEKKWVFSRSIGLSSGTLFFNGGNATYLAAPIGVQLNRRLSNNWYAFAGLSISPVYVNFNNSFLKGQSNKFFQANNGFAANSFNVNPRATMGLMYVNDQKTFSISGSINIDRSNYSYAPLNQFGAFGQGNFNSSRAFGRQ